MAINFPTSLDTLPKPANGQAMNQAGAQGGDVVSDLALAIEALQVKVGANTSAVATSLDYFRASVRGTGGIPAGAVAATTISATGQVSVLSNRVAIGQSGASASNTFATFFPQVAGNSIYHVCNTTGLLRFSRGALGAETSAVDATLGSSGLSVKHVLAEFTAAASGVTVYRSDSSIGNSNIRYQNTSGSVYAGLHGAATTWSVGGNGDLSVAGNRWFSATESGIEIRGAQVLSDRKTGWSAASGTATRTTFNTATVTLPQLAERMKAFIDDFISHGAIGA